jgi:hypothetical protein
MPQPGNDIWMLPLSGARKPQPLIQTKANDLVWHFAHLPRSVAKSPAKFPNCQPVIPSKMSVSSMAL